MLPLIVAAAALPVWIIIKLLLLSGEGGVKKAAAFAAGVIVARVLVIVARVLAIVLFGFVLGSVADQTDADDSSLVASTEAALTFVILVLGTMSLVLLPIAASAWRQNNRRRSWSG